ncbi:MAG: hypothetical protein J2P37_13670 [Ktedonobacteraceae bacterium]|nr:hypothetical protein [Ktedonobacteraceae bacterium]MBO0791441.1 hypothetical protein [Ktedonobacteraceae bacterium]
MGYMPPDPQQPNYPQGKLILPPTQQEAPPQASDATVFHPTAPRVRPEHLIRPTSPQMQGSFFTRLRQQLRNDPAYRVLAIALAGVLIAGIVFIVFASSLLASPGPQQNSAALMAQASATAAAQQAPTPEPSPTEVPTPTPTVPPVPTLEPTPTTAPDVLTLQIVSIPQSVVNGTRVPVTVQSSLPDTTVRLHVTYTGAFGSFNSRAVSTGDDGTVTLNWSVSVIGGSNRTVTATVYAVAFDQFGQQVLSQPVSVLVLRNNN